MPFSDSLLTPARPSVRCLVISDGVEAPEVSSAADMPPAKRLKSDDESGASDGEVFNNVCGNEFDTVLIVGAFLLSSQNMYH